MPKDFVKYIEESFDHLFDDVEKFKKMLIGFHKAFNSNKSTNKTEFPAINSNTFFLSPNKDSNTQGYNGSVHNNLKSNFYNEDLFFSSIFGILLGDDYESLTKNFDKEIFRNINRKDDEIIKKIIEYNVSAINSILSNVENWR